ncbi:ZN574 protein, partial [Halcyon senegalensis]|nr:ZN574 protein [Halcyon senegalensis]
MAGPEETLVLLEHRYVCSECSHLSASLEDALLHQQLHLGPSQHHQYELVGLADYQALTVPETSQYQCLECGQLLVSPGQLLEHQEMHIKLLGQETEPAACSPTLQPPVPATPGPTSNPSPLTGSIHYECVECRALFADQELWLNHRQNHRRLPRRLSAARPDPPPQQPPPNQSQALVDLEHSYRKQEEEEANGGTGDPAPADAATAAAAPPGDADTVQLLLYECADCFQLFPTPKDFLDHQTLH